MVDAVEIELAGVLLGAEGGVCEIYVTVAADDDARISTLPFLRVRVMRRSRNSQV